MSHYYSEKQTVESNESTIGFNMGNHTLKLTTDAGVFSKGGIDFGSNLLVKVFLEDAHPKRILDVGCGYGTMGLMVAKHFPESTIHMVDVNERALALSERNREANSIQNALIYKSDGLNEVTETFDAVITNPPIRAGKDVVHRILEDSTKVLEENGALYVVIQKKQGMPSAKKKMEADFGNVTVLKKDKGYYILKSVKG
ncbi:class I SAM-dependent methyltransferase [Macrococcoides caseolyticum]|uniref:class I SAM-dependent methyltransferase n=1 Tax=Macrococcoides caseolyticum TaxID=69966 RepID=UPI001F2023CA|nr:class I SAM-dependent methyltransferase [Macrococcus caseolyticus]MCE4957897.1 class I SAM-dependent methyltransferase [Macrococcus caseolyticus]